jgi:PAS domain S-box-containing protein
LDITERKRAEEALRESEERFRVLAENVPGVIYLCKNDKRWTMLFLNAVVEQLTGYPKEDFLADRISFVDLHHPDDTASIFAHVEESLAKHVPFHLVYRIQHRSGEWRWVDEVGVGIYHNGEVHMLEGFLTDITDRKRVEEELEHYRHHLETLVEERTAELNRVNAELVRANRLKDEFLANMSHELRTPLHVILGMAESLQEEVYGPLIDRQRHSLQMIEESGNHLLTLIIDILDLAKIGAGKLELEITPVLVKSTCQVALRLTKQLAQKKLLKVSTLFDSSVETVQADERHLKQVLVNLLSNAIKFTPEGGQIGLEVEGDSEQQAVHFTVWDTGIGIASEEMDRVFQPFVQLDASLSRRYEGTGLGLALIARIVDLHGGSVSVESEVGQGSRFTVSLPWKEVDDTSLPVSKGELEFPTSRTPQLATRNSQLVTRTILIAEDHETTITTLSGYFAVKGYRVMIARNGWEAVAQTREFHPDIIVMDIQMPEMDGLGAIRHIRSDQHGKSIPIIALTALAMPGDRGQCLAAGADEYFSKPVSLRKLSEVIERLLSRKE